MIYRQERNIFHATDLFLNTLKTSAKQRFYVVFRGYQKRSGMKWVNVTLENGIEMTHIINFSNPHPKETFMVWKFPSKVPIEENGYPNEHMMKEICKDKIRSTYQVLQTQMRHCAIWYNLKNAKNTHEGVLLLAEVLLKNTPP